MDAYCSGAIYFYSFKHEMVFILLVLIFSNFIFH